MHISDLEMGSVLRLQEDTIRVGGLSTGLAAAILVVSLAFFALVNAIALMCHK